MKKENKELTQLKQSELKGFREKHHKEQDEICPLLKIKISSDKMAVDHRHKLKSELPDVNGKGLIRGVIEFRANAIEGKISNAWKRYFGHDESNHPISLPDYLRNLADYLENPPLDHLKIIHPKERIREEKFSKRDYNKIKKYYFDLFPRKKTIPHYPKVKNPVMNNKWRELLDLTNKHILKLEEEKLNKKKK